MFKKAYRNIQSLRAFVILIKDPTQTEKIFQMTKGVTNSKNPFFQKVIQRLIAKPGFADLIQENYNPPIPSVEELLKMPKNTFGYGLARHMHDLNLKFDFYPGMRGEAADTYIVNRSRKMHDMWHVLTGFDTSVAGEAGLQGFTFAQLRSMFSATLLSASFLHAILTDNSIFDELTQNIFTGFEIGKDSKFLLAVRLEDRLSEDLEALRKDLGITPVKRQVA